MAQKFYDISLHDAIFPMLSENQGRTIIGSIRGEASAQDSSPGVAYCHNVMPSQYGMDSVGFLQVVPALATLPTGATFTDVRIVYGTNRTRLYLAWDNLGNVYSLVKGTTVWKTLDATTPATGGASFTSESVTIGTVNGVSHIFYAGIGSFTYDEFTEQLVAETLTGLAIANILGVVASSGYLVAYTAQAISWSSTIDPTDFVPSQVTGSGGGNVAGIAGAIIFITNNTLGLLVYTAANTMAGTYTGNVQFPFKFREVDNSKGGISLDKVAYEANSAKQFVFSKAGMQSITSRATESILPDVTDFLAGKRFEDYNEATDLYEITDLGAAVTMQKKIKYIASRYLVISYGITAFTHAIVFDTALQRSGKIKLTHVDCFEYVDEQTEVSRENIAFVSATGVVQVLDFSATASSSGVLVLGKVQFVRSRLITLLGVEAENVEAVATLTIGTQAALDGKNFTFVAGTVSTAAGNLREFKFRSTAKNHSIVFKGKFNLVTAQVRYTVASRR